MSNILTSLTISSITASATSFLSAFAPYIELIVGVLLAFFIINYLVSILGKNTTSGNMKNDFNLYHHSNAEMEAKGIDAFGIEEYNEDI
jgi:hypothetical protein